MNEHQGRSPTKLEAAKLAAMEGRLRVTVIIVSYNTVDLLRVALHDLQDPRQEVHEVIVVDNASSDGSAEMVAKEYPKVNLVRNTVNRGFGAANNQGLDMMTGDLALLLNSDAEPQQGSIPKLAAVFADPEVVAAGGKLLFPDGRLQQSACNPLTLWAVWCEQSLAEKLLPNSPLFSPYWMSSRLLKTGNGPFPVAQVMGACLMMRPAERFDERFFLYCEDTELCKRLCPHGKILYVPGSEYIHHLGASSAQTRWESVARYNRGKELYFKIHHGPIQSFFCWWMNRCGAFLRLFVWWIMAVIHLGQGRYTGQFWLFFRVLFAPISGPRRPSDSG